MIRGRCLGWSQSTALSLLLALTAAAQETPLISPGDLVHVQVHRHAELSTAAQVDETGNIQLPYIGRVTVGGLSETDATARVAAGLSAILKNPRVTVTRGLSLQPLSDSGRTEAMVTRIVRLENSSAEVLQKALSSMTTPGGAVSYDPDTNTLILTDTPATLQNMLSVVQELDQMQSQVTQVHIETRIAEVESTAAKEIGIRWFVQGDHAMGGYYQNPRQDTKVNSVRANNDPIFNERLDSGNYRNSGVGGRRYIDEARFDRRMQIPVQIAAPGQMFLGYLNAGVDLGAMIDALVADNKAQMLATPYIRTVNNKPAQIKMTEEFPYSELGSAGLNTFASTRFMDIGIMLDVTPHVRKDTSGTTYIQLDLKPEVSSVSGMANGVPVRSVRSSHSVANVVDGQTLVIGGIIQSNARDVLQKVPGLGSVPLLGHLFQHKEKSKEDTELMIFVTPTVFEKPGDIAWDRAINMPAVAENGNPLYPLESNREQRKD